MADKLYSTYSSLLAPGELITVETVLRDRSVIPDERGIYGWWFREQPSIVPLEGTIEHQGYLLLYVGIAPQKPSTSGSASRSTLRKRISGNHLGRRLGSSTLRRSLAALLQVQLGLTISRGPDGKRRVMSREHEIDLTSWLTRNAAISFMVCDNAWDIEDELLALDSPRLPLNIDGAKHDFRNQLMHLRAHPEISVGKTSSDVSKSLELSLTSSLANGRRPTICFAACGSGFRLYGVG